MMTQQSAAIKHGDDDDDSEVVNNKNDMSVVATKLSTNSSERTTRQEMPSPTDTTPAEATTRLQPNPDLPADRKMECLDWDGLQEAFQRQLEEKAIEEEDSMQKLQNLMAVRSSPNT